MVGEGNFQWLRYLPGEKSGFLHPITYINNRYKAVYFSIVRSLGKVVIKVKHLFSSLRNLHIPGSI